MTPTVHELSLWPSKVMALEYRPDDPINAALEAFVLARCNVPEDEDEALRHEIRVHGLFDHDAWFIATLRERVTAAAWRYLGERARDRVERIEVCGRAIVLPDRGFVNTHVERREAEIGCAYFLTGDAVGKPISHPGNPGFVLEDPGRSLTDLRLPFEQRHSVTIAPRPGLMVLFPNHVPHHVEPYRDHGAGPHVQIVCNLRIQFNADYLCQMR